MKFKEEQEVYIEFYDHVQGSDVEITCEIWGRVLSENKVSVTLAVWDLRDTDPQTRLDNQLVFCIIKGTIISWRVLK